LIGFGTFGITKARARAILHPETGDTIQLPAGRRPKFTAGKKLKAAVNKVR
jgi:DNA-binding protein HU-beta